MTEPHGRPAAYRKELSDPALTSLVRWVVSHDLRTPGAPPPIDRPLDDRAWLELRSFIESERVTTVFTEAVAAGIPATTAQSDQATALQRDSTMNDLFIEGVLLDLADTFDDAGINWRLVKGLATSRVLYNRPAQRSTGDVDVVVHPDQYLAALDLLRGTGRVISEQPQQGPVTAKHYRCHTIVHESQVELDVHRYVEGTIPRFRIPTAVLFDDPQTVTISGRRFLAPSTPVLILNAMLHLSTGKTGPNSLARLSTLTDLLRGRVHFAEEYAEALRIAKRCGCATPAIWADLVVRDWLAEQPAPGDPRVPISVKAYDRLLRTPGAISVVERLVGPQRLRRSWEAAFPSPEYCEAHGRSGVGQLSYIVSELRRGKRRS